MCRHLAYLGPPLPLSALLFDPPHSLVRQSWAPRDMRGGGTVNADGFGVGWYPADAEAGAEPIRYRGDRPVWTDAALPALAAAQRARAVLAAVRSATVGMPVVSTAAAPFAAGRWLFSHNGVVPGWPDSLVPLAAGLPTRDLLTLDAPSDAALLWALVRHRLRRGVATEPEAAAETAAAEVAEAAAQALTDTVRAVRAAAPGARLNLLLTDGRVAVATAVGHALSVRAGDGAVLIASEPLDDDPRWRPVPEWHLVLARAGHAELRPLQPP